MNRVIKKAEDEYMYNFTNYQFDYLNQEIKRQPSTDQNLYKKGAWRFLRFRIDKEGSNSFKTFKNVMKSIEENITLEDISKATLDRLIDVDEMINKKMEKKSFGQPNLIIENSLKAANFKTEKFLGNKKKTSDQVEEQKEIRNKYL
jgi:hypothetical protein